MRASSIASPALAAIDAPLVLQRNRQQNRMTRKEIIDVSKRAFADPLIKSQRRARQLNMSRNHMIAAIAERTWRS